jgi:uncharacterized Rmd1/YagE family protein
VADDPDERVGKTIMARAWFLGSRIDVRQLERGETVALAPLTLRPAEGGYAVVFRFGAVVFVDVSPMEQASFIEKLAPFLTGRFEDPETEDAEIRVDPERGDGVDAMGLLMLRAASVDRIQVVADVLAKSAVLTHYEERVAKVFDRIEVLAAHLGRGASPAHGRELLREIGSVLLIQTRTVGRVEVAEKPEITWENPELDRFFERLSVEYELRDRDVALSRKLELVAHTAQTYLNLLQDRQSIRLEWYIVILIAVEIVLILYDIFLAR